MTNNEDCPFYNSCNHIDCNKPYCTRRIKIDALYDLALIPKARRKHIKLVLDINLTDEQEFCKLVDIERNIVKFVNSGQSLYIHSSIAGNGKTSWSIRLLTAYLKSVWLTTPTDECKALFVNVPSYLLGIKSAITKPNEEIEMIKDNILQADIVVFDDIGTKVATSFEHENLLSIIDTRINNGKCNIFTSNLNDDELHEALGDRLASRICSTPNNIELKGKDKRGISQDEIK